MEKIPLQPPFKNRQWVDPQPNSNREYGFYPIRSAYPFWRAKNGRYTHIVRSGLLHKKGWIIFTGWCGNSIGTAGVIAGRPTRCFPLCERCKLNVKK